MPTTMNRNRRRGSLTKNDIAWEKLFRQHRLLKTIETNGYATITSQQIGAVREVRLMTKFDHKEDLPKIFLENKLAILPLSRQLFVVGHFDCYKVITEDPNVELTHVPFLSGMQLLREDSITTEQSAISAADLCGIFKLFFNDADLNFVDLGRSSTGTFDFKIRNSIEPNKSFHLNVNRAQMEIDACLESPDRVVVVEAKQMLGENFLVRLLFYPFMAFVKDRHITKDISLLYLFYQDGIYELFEYKADVGDYNSMRLVKQENYSTRTETITTEDLSHLIEYPLVAEPEVPFPQANDFKKVIGVLNLLSNEGEADNDRIIEANEFVNRQADYYLNALRYLGLAYKSAGVWKLTEDGKQILRARIREKNLELAKLILQHRAFRETYRLMSASGKMPSEDSIVAIMKESNLYNVGTDSTYYRRSSTIVAWMKWISELVSE